MPSVLELLVLLSALAPLSPAQDCNPATLSSLFQDMLRIMTDDTFGAPTGSEDIDEACEQMREVFAKLDVYLDRCAPPHMRPDLSRNFEGGQKALKLLCEDDPFREAYLSHTECFQKMAPEFQTCGQPYSEALKALREPISNTSVFIQRTKDACCAFFQYKVCAEREADRLCGKSAAEFIQTYMDNVVSLTMRRECALFELDADCPNPSSATSTSLSPSPLHHLLPILPLHILILFLLPAI